MRAHAVAAQPTGRGQLQGARERAVIGEQQETLGVEIETSDADEVRQAFWKNLENCRASARIGMRGQVPCGL